MQASCWTVKKMPSVYFSFNQTANLKDIFKCEGWHLISDMLHIMYILKLKSSLVTADIQKAFNPAKYLFLVSVVEKYDFRKAFINWIKALLKNQESCVINIMMVLLQGISS